MTRSSRWFATALVVLALIFAAAARAFFRPYTISTTAAASIYAAFTLLLILSLAPALWGVRSDAALSITRRGVCIASWCLPYLVYAAGTGDFRWSAVCKLMAVATLPVALYTVWPPKNKRTLTWQDGIVAVLLAGFVLSGQLGGIWNVPVNLDFMSRLFLITVASWTWTVIRPVPDLGYSFAVTTTVLRQAAVNFALFAVIAIPASLAMHFTRWNPRWPGLAQFLLNYLEIFLFIAVLEELFFRGFLQTLVSEALRSAVAGQILVSVLFGLFHILHAPFPNWRYVALATVAGWFYGSAFRASGSLMASSLLHAAVDTVWRTWLSAR